MNLGKIVLAIRIKQDKKFNRKNTLKLKQIHIVFVELVLAELSG
jgi:hypothetical protein